MKQLFTFLILFLTFNANAAGPIGSAIAPPTYAGYIVKKGDLGAKSDAISSNFKFGFPLAANELCNYEFPDSRAAYYEDIKYIYKDLPASINYYVLDVVQSQYDRGSDSQYLLKNGQLFTGSDEYSDRFCKSYTSTLSSDYTYVLSTVTNNFMNRSCNLDVRLICVFD